MKFYFIFFLISFSRILSQPWADHGKIIVNPKNPHYLAHEDGTNFFYLGDTAWELFFRLNREEADIYLKDRAEKNFNVIQAVVLSEWSNLIFPNVYGDFPFTNGSSMKPNVTNGNDPADSVMYDFWDNVDYIIEKAEELNLYIGILPCWGEYVIARNGKPFFNTAEEIYSYGNYLGKRYAQQPNLIWILGGDRQPDERDNGIELWRAMAEGIADGVNGIYKQDGDADYSSTLMTHHSYNSSSNWFHEDAWIDFHTYGSYHSNYGDDRSYLLAEKDWSLKNPKPTINSEPAYEGHPLNWIKDNGIFTAYDVRQIAYWSVFAGAAGYTYGAHSIWQFYNPKYEKISMVELTWQKALNMAGAVQIKYLKELINSRPIENLRPDQTLIADKVTYNYSRVCAVRSDDYAYIYIPTGISTNVDLTMFEGEKITAEWFNPRTGELSFIGNFSNKKVHLFDPPGMSKELSWLQTGRGCDWVLVLSKL
ncbi:MAG: glycoside hydrolase family 140 protein [Melioribacteraceae bacterium]|nr:glycoside hydrolase family 140 protein [Melioribacteraceae bacterium]